MSKKLMIVMGVSLLTSIFIFNVENIHKAGATDRVICHKTGKADKNIHTDEADKSVRYKIVVNYSRSLEDSIKAGRYNFSNIWITEENLPLGKDEQGKKEQTFKLYRLNEDVVIAQMEKDGYRPATLRELLAFGEANPRLQNNSQIIALGSVWVVPDGCHRVAYLDGSDSTRTLGLYWCGYSWRNDCRFLAVDKTH